MRAIDRSVYRSNIILAALNLANLLNELPGRPSLTRPEHWDEDYLVERLIERCVEAHKAGDEGRAEDA